MPRLLHPTRFALTSFVALGFACNSQVGPEYTGEVLLHLTGSVQTTSAGQEQLTPALMFQSYRDQEGQDVTAVRHFVRGTIRGQFPSGFELDITQPPPPEAMSNGFAFGTFALIDEDVPAVVPLPRLETSSFCLDLREDGCGLTSTYCTTDGECLTREASCQVTDCEMLETEGDPAVLDSLLVLTTSGEWVSRTQVRPAERVPDEVRGGREHSTFDWVGEQQVETILSCNSDSQCYREVIVCPLSDPLLQFPMAEQVVTCEVTQQSGDPNVGRALETTPTASNYSVLYLNEEGVQLVQPLFAGVQVGYNVLEALVPNREQWVERSKCLADATATAIENVNEQLGTNYHLGQTLPEEAEDDFSIGQFALAQECFNPYQLTRVEDLSQASLQIELGRPSQGL